MAPLVREMERHCGGRPEQVLAASGLYSGDNLDVLEERGVDGYVPDSNLGCEINPGKAVQEPRPPQHRATLRMRHKFTSAGSGDEPIYSAGPRWNR